MGGWGCQYGQPRLGRRHRVIQRVVRVENRCQQVFAHRQADERLLQRVALEERPEGVGKMEGQNANFHSREEDLPQIRFV